MILTIGSVVASCLEWLLNPYHMIGSIPGLNEHKKMRYPDKIGYRSFFYIS